MINKFKAALILMLALMLALSPAVSASADSGAEASGDDGISGIPGWPQGTPIKADGAIVVEASTGTVLYAKNIYDRFYPASTTKILTTLVALENSSFDELVTVSHAADSYVSATSSRMGLTEGEQLTMEQALYGIMLESGNEATYAVGEHVAGSISKFIRMMNRKAEELGCDSSHFANSHGLHDAEHYTCCHDMMLIARAAYANPDFMRIAGASTFDMPATNKHDAKVLTNHHWFLNGTMRYDYCIGGKTGATTEAGYALVTYAKKDGMTLISVVMHAPTWDDVYRDSKNLLNYCFDNFKQYNMSDQAVLGGRVPSMFDSIELFDAGLVSTLSVGEGGVVILPDNIPPDRAKREIIFDDTVKLRRGENRIGTIVFTYQGRQVGSAGIMYYNSSTEMTDAEFDEAWPDYMIPVDTALEAAGVVIGGPPAMPEWEDVLDMEIFVPAVVGGALGLTVILAGLIVLRRRRHR